MFYYYGAKNLLSRYYPVPRFDVIVEPFAGSAAYSCFHLMWSPQKRAVLVDKDDRVAGAWEFLLSATEADILNYPKPEVGGYTSDFLVMTCAVSNATSKCCKMKYTERLDRVFEIQRRRLLRLLPLRDRIEFIHGNYDEVGGEATWFIDPPYQVVRENGSVFQNGKGYAEGCGSQDLDYGGLAEFCQSRVGQVIVCEKEGADWLDFQPFRRNKTSLNRNYNEVAYLRE